ncbi:MAG: hypothetical protein P9F19_17665 [Candidatus Contendobacter sp.]|nr:hypothetical protein [Candidatus Contendobacter sp.]MDG4559194.1 hypothetical protein [Candidatus Contendobacter sp.]
MKTRMLLCSTIVSALLGAGCSTAHIAPDVAKFSTAVESTTGQVLKRYDGDAIEAKYRAELNTAMVANNVTLMPVGCIEPLRFDQRIESEKFDDFSKHCALQQARRDRSMPNPPIRPPSNGPGAQGYSARRLSLALQNYAKSLLALAQSDTPSKLGSSFTNASTAIFGLIDEADKFQGAPPPSDRTTAIRSANTDLFGSLLTEAFEARRYAMLSSIVKDADSSVEIAAVALASWAEEPEIADLRARYDSLKNALGDAARAEGAGNASRAIAELARARSAYDAVVEGEANATWKMFFDIARTHRAILDSFDNPGDPKQLAEANKRINSLAEKVEKVKAAKKKS